MNVIVRCRLIGMKNYKTDKDATILSYKLHCVMFCLTCPTSSNKNKYIASPKIVGRSLVSEIMDTHK